VAEDAPLYPVAEDAPQSSSEPASFLTLLIVKSIAHFTNPAIVSLAPILTSVAHTLLSSFLLSISPDNSTS
jgi:hypothetical protein